MEFVDGVRLTQMRAAAADGGGFGDAEACRVVESLVRYYGVTMHGAPPPWACTHGVTVCGACACACACAARAWRVRGACVARAWRVRGACEARARRVRGETLLQHLT